MLNKEILDALVPKEMFAAGVSFDTEAGLFLANTGRLLRWVAIRGEIGDWTVYTHFAEHDWHWISRHGDKVCMESNIRKLVPCTDEAFKMYRY